VYLDQVTVLVLTFDEAPNIGRTLDALGAFTRVLVMDSGSTDGTQSIAAAYPNVRVLTRPFDTHAAQWNAALAACDSAWVLALDADYLVSREVVDEIASVEPAGGVGGFRAGFRYRVNGRTLTSSLYPPVTVLFRRERAHFVQDGHTHRVVVEGAVHALRGTIVHDDRKPLSRWLAAQQSYARLEADLLRSRPWAQLRLQDKLRRMVFVTPWLVPLYCLTVGRGFMDGRAGMYYALQRGLAEMLLGLALLETASPHLPRPK
jgi:glycosyltransferase involved in cell wall biosynthesis